MHFENTFEVAGDPRQVMDLFGDLPTMAGFVPGASLGGPDPDGSHPATLVVAFGPKRIAFRGRITHDPDPSELAGRVTGRASADLRGAKMSVTMAYRLAAAPSGTEVTLVSDAELTGMLAEFARTGGVAVADALIADFARRFSAHVAATGGAPDDETMEPVAAVPPALSGVGILVQVVKAALRSMWAKVRRGR